MYEYRAVLIRVVDADTVRLEVDLGFYVRRADQPYRLARIDAPEMSTDAGKTAKAWLELQLAGVTFLMVQTQRADNFGRFIAELYADGRNVSDALVAAGMAVYKTY